MRLASRLGSEEFYVASIPLMTWLVASPHVSRVTVMLFGLNMAVGNFLKNAFALPRPPVEYLVTEGKGSGALIQPTIFFHMYSFHLLTRSNI